VQKGPFPFTISIRKQTPEMLAFDDLLALTPCHLNIIPTSAYIPDWRFLLCRPLDGLRLINKLEDAAWEITSTQYIGNPEWRGKFLKGGQKRLSKRAVDKLRKHVVCGCNFPPSQFHLHIQYMMLPLIPFQYHMYRNGAHYTFKRFFPLSYIKAVLQLNEPIQVTMEMPVDDIIAHFDARGVSYADMHKAMYDSVETSHQLLANWRADDFETVIDGETVVGRETSKGEMVGTDKAVLQMYGRPYSDKGRPSGTYYKFARTERVPEWQDIDSRKFSQASLPMPITRANSMGKILRNSRILGRNRHGAGHGEGHGGGAGGSHESAIGKLWRLVQGTVKTGQLAGLREGEDEGSATVKV